jgi:hypothetical protein
MGVVGWVVAAPVDAVDWATIGGVVTAIVVGVAAIRQRRVEGETQTTVAGIGAELARAQAVESLYGTLTTEIARLRSIQTETLTRVAALEVEIVACHGERDAARAETAALRTEVDRLRTLLGWGRGEN